MLTPRRAVQGLVVAVCLTVGVAAAMSVAGPVIFPPPIVSASTVTLRTTSDTIGLAVAWVRRCVGGVCPPAHDLVVTRKSGGFFNREADRRVLRFKDTVRVARPTCPIAGGSSVDTMLVGVRAVGTTIIERSNAGTTVLTVRCRAVTAAELAESTAILDSFPDGARRIAMSDWAHKVPKSERDIWLVEQLRVTRTAADSVGVRATFAAIDAWPDSVRAVQGSDALQTVIGYEYAFCWLGRNRYTGAVALLDGDAVACEAPRARMQSERSG